MVGAGNAVLLAGGFPFAHRCEETETGSRPFVIQYVLRCWIFGLLSDDYQPTMGPNFDVAVDEPNCENPSFPAIYSVPPAEAGAPYCAAGVAAGCGTPRSRTGS